MSHQVATPFMLEGVKYETGQLLDESFPAGSVACNVRLGRIVKLTEAEMSDAKAEVQSAEAARKKQAEKEAAKKKADEAKAAKIKKAADEKAAADAAK